MLTVKISIKVIHQSEYAIHLSLSPVSFPTFRHAGTNSLIHYRQRILLLTG